MSKLKFISDKDLTAHTKKVLDVFQAALDSADEKLHKNSIDPFSAVFDSTSRGISLLEWLDSEKARQSQKTLQNAIGDFHQDILGSIPGWENLKTGNVFDIKNDERKIIAEIKNKHNTTKGNHKKSIYDDLAGQLSASHKGYTAYYVEIIPKSKQAYDKTFTPPDNETHTRRPEREDIRVIDGKSFYALATGEDNSLEALYSALPDVIEEILDKKQDISKDSIFRELFEKIY